MAYYIYENWQAGPHKTVIHHGTCGYCNEGKGRAGDYDPSHAKWHSAFKSLEDARAFQKTMNVVVIKECGCVGKY